jgi:hypothetical protein
MLKTFCRPTRDPAPILTHSLRPALTSGAFLIWSQIAIDDVISTSGDFHVAAQHSRQRRIMGHKHMKDGGSAGIDLALQDGVLAKIEALEEALDEATSKPSSAEWDKVREAADELMRALAAVMMKLRKPQLSS